MENLGRKQKDHIKKLPKSDFHLLLFNDSEHVLLWYLFSQTNLSQLTARRNLQFDFCLRMQIMIKLIIQRSTARNHLRRLPSISTTAGWYGKAAPV